MLSLGLNVSFPWRVRGGRARTHSSVFVLLGNARAPMPVIKMLNIPPRYLHQSTVCRQITDGQTDRRTN